MTELDALNGLAERAAGEALPPLEATKSIDALIEATGGGPNAAFDFQHKVFALPGARFAIDRRARAAMFYMHLGNLNVSLTPMVLRREFNIEAGSHDSHLVELAAKALRYVKEIRPGDSIPRELVDGTASWTVEERHRRLARAKLFAQILAWFQHSEDGPSAESILAFARQESISAELQGALDAFADMLGIEAERRLELVAHVDVLAREIAYVEALREHAGQLQQIRERIMQIACAAKRDKHLIEELTRSLTLLKQPIAEFAQQFADLDRRMEARTVLRQDRWLTIRAIREGRDRIHASLLPWNEIFATWRDQEVIVNPQTRENMGHLLRWLAANYAPAEVWQ